MDRKIHFSKAGSLEAISMLAIVNCKSCELSAKYIVAADESRTLVFDAAQFHALCQKAHLSPALDCPDLTNAIKAAVWLGPAGIRNLDYLAIPPAAAPTTSLSDPKVAPSTVVGAQVASHALTVNCHEKTTEKVLATNVKRANGHTPWGLILTTGLAVLIIAVVGFLFIGVTHQPTTAIATKPQESVVITRQKTDAPAHNSAQAFDPQSLPAPENTIRRMDGIRKAFSKK